MEIPARTKRITVRFMVGEFNGLKEQVFASGLSIAEFARRRILGHAIASKMDFRVLSELRRLGGLVKHAFNETGDMYSRDTAETLHALTSCVRKLERFIANDSKNTPYAAG